jgi:eukaryotic translation initiation factor 2C
MIADFQSMFEERILAYHKTQKSWPERVLYYRDGGSEGQYPQIRRAEVAKIRTAFEHVVPANQR